MKRRSIQARAIAAIAMLVALLAIPESAQSGSGTDVGAPPYNRNQNLRFTLTYPRFLRFRVGTDSVGAIDSIAFSVPGISVGDSTPILGTGGDAGGSTANVAVFGNGGQVIITPTNNSGGAGLGTGNAADGWINYDQIETQSSSVSLPAPVLSNAGGTASQPLVSGVVTQQVATWTFRYLNATIPSAGIYGTSANGGRVTYTASSP